MCWLQMTCHSVCKLDSCVRGIPNEGVSSFPSLQFLLVSFASSGVARQHTCRIISPNMKKGNSTNRSNCHSKLLAQTLETTRSPIRQVFDRGVYDSHYLNCSAMLGPQPPTLSTLGFELTVTVDRLSRWLATPKKTPFVGPKTQL